MAHSLTVERAVGCMASATQQLPQQVPEIVSQQQQAYPLGLTASGQARPATSVKRKGGGRPADPVWDYYNTVMLEPAAAKKLKRNKNGSCKACGIEIRGQPEYLHKHLAVCSKIESPPPPRTELHAVSQIEHPSVAARESPAEVPASQSTEGPAMPPISMQNAFHLPQVKAVLLLLLIRLPKLCVLQPVAAVCFPTSGPGDVSGPVLHTPSLLQWTHFRIPCFWLCMHPDCDQRAS